jgi:hypothetical protein
MEKASQEVRILGLSLRILLQANGLRARTLGIITFLMALGPQI